jgi:hypothetical protein
MTMDRGFGMRDLEELNINDGTGKPVTRRPPTPDQISFIEELVGTRIPQSYIEFLKFSNGGCAELDTFYYEFEGIERRESVDTFFHISTDCGSSGDVAWEYKHRWNGIPEQFLPIACNGLGDLICLDLTGPGGGRVVIWIHDIPANQLRSVANSFEEFIDLLTLRPDDI